MARTIILLLDSFGIGYAHDAEAYGDKGADTLGHICDWLAKNPRHAGEAPVRFKTVVMFLSFLPQLRHGETEYIMLHKVLICQY